SADCVSVRKIGSGAAFVSTQPGATEGWRLSANGRRESANGQPEDCVRRSNCPTQAKRRLEWHPSAPAKITSRPSFWDRRRESGKSTPLMRIACYDPTTSTSDQVYGGWPTLRSLKGGIPRTPLSWDSESRCTTR